MVFSEDKRLLKKLIVRNQ